MQANHVPWILTDANTRKGCLQLRSFDTTGENYRVDNVGLVGEDLWRLTVFPGRRRVSTLADLASDRSSTLAGTDSWRLAVRTNLVHAPDAGWCSTGDKVTRARGLRRWRLGRGLWRHSRCPRVSNDDVTAHWWLKSLPRVRLPAITLAFSGWAWWRTTDGRLSGRGLCRWQRQRRPSASQLVGYRRRQRCDDRRLRDISASVYRRSLAVQTDAPRSASVHREVVNPDYGSFESVIRYGDRPAKPRWSDLREINHRHRRIRSSVLR